MALCGTPTEVLMHYSGHTSERTLLRYLGWGMAAGHIQGNMQQAGKALIPTTVPLTTLHGLRRIEEEPLDELLSTSSEGSYDL